jgi:hypothetical protein
MTGKFINSGGLVLDILGAWFLAWEIVNQFKGNDCEAQPLTACGEIPPPLAQSTFLS